MVVTRNHQRKYHKRKGDMNIKSFMQYLKTQTTSEETLRAYRQDLEKYQAFLRGKGLRVNQAKASTISEFVNHLAADHGGAHAPATVSRRLAVLSAFYEYLRDDANGNIRNPVESVKRPKVDNELPRAVDDNILATLVNGVTDKRDKAIILLFLYTGLRLSELRQLDTNSIKTRKRAVPGKKPEFYGEGSVIGKGRKRRSFLVGPVAMKAIKEYIKEFRAGDKVPAPLFLSQRRQRISCRTIQEIVNSWCKKLGLGHIHIHQLRHSFATRNVNAGMSATVLQELMGHANLSTTQRYFRVKPERLSREYFSVMEFVRQCSPV
jgi:site-specific recombinase XerD